MLDKKKGPAPKVTEKRVRPQAAKPAGEAAHAAPTPAGRQRESFEAAVKLFHARRLKEARELFLSAAEGPESDVAQRCRLHVAMCNRRLEQPPVELRSAEDHYNYGVALINSRKLAEARVQLEKALEMSPGRDHIHYALALAQALGGDPLNGYANLKRAIDLEPRNRMIARHDSDFATLANQPPFDGLLYPEKQAWPEKKGW